MATTNGQSVKERVREERDRRRKDARIEEIRKRAKHDRTIVEFQPDAVEIEHRKVPGGARWTLYTVVGFITCFVCWSYWAQVDQIVVGQGKLITTENAVVVQSIETQTIHSIDVKFGDRVRAGQVVATLDPTFTDADLTQLKAQRKAQLAKITRLEAQLNGTEFSISGNEGDREWETQLKLFKELQLEMDAELKKFDAEIAKLASAAEMVEKTIPTKKETVAAQKGLYAKESELWKNRRTSERTLLSQKVGYLQSQDDLEATLQSIADFKADKLIKETERDAMIAKRRSALATELSESNQLLTGVEQEINKANRMDELLELRVPNDSGHNEFVVFEVADRSVGSILQKGEPLFKLIPIDVPLEAEVEITGKDVAKIRVLKNGIGDGKMPNGSKVTLKLSAFDYQDHGTLNGYVRAISEGVFEKQQGPQQTAANYKARIKIVEPATLKNVPTDFRLMPGMATTAEIKVGRRRVIQYFLYPILRYLDEGFREP